MDGRWPAAAPGLAGVGGDHHPSPPGSATPSPPATTITTTTAFAHPFVDPARTPQPQQTQWQSHPPPPPPPHHAPRQQHQPYAFQYTSPTSSPLPAAVHGAALPQPPVYPARAPSYSSAPPARPLPVAGPSRRAPQPHHPSLPYTTVPLATVHERAAAAAAASSSSSTAALSPHSTLLPPRAHSYDPAAALASSSSNPSRGPPSALSRGAPQRASLPSLSPPSSSTSLLQPTFSPPSASASPTAYLAVAYPSLQYQPAEQARIRRMYEDRQRAWGGRGARESSAASLSSSATSSSSSPIAHYHALARSPHAPHTGLAGMGHVAGSSAAAAAAAAAADKKEGRRKKVAKACLACQKSHLTCDEQRPCTRCVKKGQGDQCVEGVRKKAKYLLEGDERAASASAAAKLGSSPDALTPLAASVPLPVAAPSSAALAPTFAEPLVPMADEQQQQAMPNDIWLTAPLAADMPDVTMGPPAQQWTQPEADPYSFTSAAANTEYEMFDSLFGPFSPSFPMPDLAPSSLWNYSMPGAPSASAGGPSDAAPTGFQPAGPATAISGAGAAMPPLPQLPPGGAYGASALASQRSSVTDQQVFTPAQYDGGGAGGSGGAGAGGAGGYAQPTIGETPEDSRTLVDIYQGVTQGYDYTEGYHFLMRHLQDNYDKNEVLRVVKALAAYRPSLIALQVNMSKEDEVFLEQAFQRTMIELEKQEALSDTPKAIWRRTGEIVYASRFFCQIVGRDAAELFGPGIKTYIYQLMSKQSMIEYWENFSGHAFENTTQYWYQTTNLLVAGGGSADGAAAAIEAAAPDAAQSQPQPRAFAGTYSIRRDVFDLPSVVIGSFLPVPGADELRQ